MTKERHIKPHHDSQSPEYGVGTLNAETGRLVIGDSGARKTVWLKIRVADFGRRSVPHKELLS
jgi:hypothetical protein